MSLRGIIPCIPEPNHRRLVHECYPKSKTAADPDSNALGKLVFYTKSRPIKLAKVSKVLLNRHDRYPVTLAIVRKLLEECKNDVNVFGDETVEIINGALKSRDEQVLERAADAFFALAILSPAVDYIPTLRHLCSMATDKQSSQRRIIGLHALDGVASSDSFYGSDFPTLADLVMPAVLDNLNDADPRDLEDDSLKAEPSRPNLNQRARSLRSAKGMFEKPPSSIDVGRAAYRILRTIFSSAHPRHLDLLCKYCKQHPWLPQRYLHWTPAQYQFAIISFWLEESLASESSLSVLTQLLSNQILNLAVGDVLSTIGIILARDPSSKLAREAIMSLQKYPGIVDMLVMHADEQPAASDAFLECADALQPGLLESRRRAEQVRIVEPQTPINGHAHHHLPQHVTGSPTKNLAASVRSRPGSVVGNVSLAELKQSLGPSGTANNSTANTSVEDVSITGSSPPQSPEKKHLASIVGDAEPHRSVRMNSLKPPYQLS